MSNEVEQLELPLLTENIPPEVLHRRAITAFGSLTFLTQNGTNHTEMIERNREAAIALFTPQAIQSPRVQALKDELDDYTEDPGHSDQQLRNYIKLKLIELTMSQKEVVQLKALELLGKVSEIGAFSENINVNVSNRSTEDIETDLAKRLGKFLDIPLIGSGTTESPTKPPKITQKSVKTLEEEMEDWSVE